MTRRLQLIEESSHKFWQIETTGKDYKITYGKHGTTGTSRSKSFDSEDECLIAAHAAIHDKEKNGYSESRIVELSDTAREKKESLKVIFNEFGGIIKAGKKEDLLPFLQKHLKGRQTEFRKHLATARLYWTTRVLVKVEGPSSTYAPPGGKEQYSILAMAAIAIIDKSQLRTWGAEILSELNSLRTNNALQDLLLWVKPAWLTEALITLSRNANWPAFLNYDVLVSLEEQQLVSYSEELMARSLVDFRQPNKVNLYDPAFLIAYPKTIERDIKEIFNYDTHIASVGKWDYNGIEPQWPGLFKAFTDRGLLSRELVIGQCLLAQTKEWNLNSKSLYRVVLEHMKPSADELMVHQHVLFHMLQNAGTPVVNYAVKLCKELYMMPDFRTADFLDWLAPILMRSDCKAGIKSILVMLEKIAKTDAGFRQVVSRLVVDVFSVADADLQERAFKLLSKTGNPSDQVLHDKFQVSGIQMQGNIRTDIMSFLGITGEIAEGNVETVYQFEPSEVKLLDEPVTLPSNWNEVLFKIGEFIREQDVITTEIVWNIFATQRHLFPHDYKEQLAPYHKQLQQILRTQHEYQTKKFLLVKMVALDQPCEFKTRIESLDTARLCEDLLTIVDRKTISGSTLPLLSFPSHLPYYVAPKVLAERIISYQETGEHINSIDLAIAICRMPRENTGEAIPLLDKMRGAIRPLMAYCFGATDKLEITLPSFFTKLLNSNKTEKDAGMNRLWAVAARTYFPTQDFKELKDIAGAHLPFVASAHRPGITIEDRWHEYTHPATKEVTRTYAGRYLTITSEEPSDIPKEFVYSLDMQQKVDKHFWHSRMNEETAVEYIHSLTPQNTDKLALLLLAWCKTPDYSSKGDSKGFLNLLVQPHFRITRYVMIAFACNIFNDKKEIRLFAHEVLFQLIEQNRLDVDEFAKICAWLVNEKYGSFLRIVDAGLSIKDSSSKHNSALFRFFDCVLSTIKPENELPNHFKKFLESYFDLKVKTGHEPGAETITFLQSVKQTESLKKIISQLTMHVVAD